MVPVNYWAILVCGVSNMVIGFLWYGPLFGKTWIKLSGIIPGKIEDAKKNGMASGYALAFVGALLMAFVLDHAIIFAGAYLNETGITAGLMGAFWNWLGFIAPVTLSVVLWEGKSWKLWCLQNTYYLITLLVMGMILVSWM